MPRLSECLRILRARGFAEVASPGDDEGVQVPIDYAIEVALLHERMTEEYRLDGDVVVQVLEEGGVMTYWCVVPLPAVQGPTVWELIAADDVLDEQEVA